MKEVCRGNKAALGQLYDRYFQPLCRFAFGFLHDDALAEDLVQEVFIRVAQKPEAYQPQHAFHTWIFTLVANRCKNELRNLETRRRLLETDVPSPRYTSDQDARLQYQELKRRISQLNEKEQSVFQLRFEQDLSLAEIAQILNIPEGTVKSTLYYLLKKIKTPLQDIIHGK